MARSWDVFCRVIDNYGDAAVCWRLARQLAAEHGGRVRLWLDELPVLQALCPVIDPERDQQRAEGVEIRRWSADETFVSNAIAGGLDEADLPDIVIEGFGCGLPDNYAEALAQRSPGSLWITLEYLSAEPWVAKHHGLPSPHPRLPLRRYFFFPGFAPDTGGLLKEAGLEARRDAFRADPQALAAWWGDLGFAPPVAGATRVSLFGYENPGVDDMLRAWSEGGEDVVAAVAAGRLAPRAAQFFGTEAGAQGSVIRRGRLEARFLPFLPQPRYDELLWACDWNFVRGEDSLVRALWAERPLVWHIYPQAERAHWVKLEAFLDAYCAGLEPAPARALRDLWQAWNRAGELPSETSGPVAAAWPQAAGHGPRLARHARDWALSAAKAGNLAEKLARFCEDRLKSPAS